MTRTFATLAVSERAYREIEQKLHLAQYHHLVNDSLRLIDMMGIALVIDPADMETAPLVCPTCCAVLPAPGHGYLGLHCPDEPKGRMVPTPELDKHWEGHFWCNTCEFYTGQPGVHSGHDLVPIPIQKEGRK